MLDVQMISLSDTKFTDCMDRKTVSLFSTPVYFPTLFSDEADNRPLATANRLIFLRSDFLSSDL
jgi:hypothetical protein